MKITADTNLLVRLFTDDNSAQSQVAREALASAERVVLPLSMLCELVWVLSKGYRLPQPDIAVTIRRLINSGNVLVDRAAAEAGLTQMDRGGDFADGVIAYDGARMGADIFVSFDRTAVKLLEAQGYPSQLLA